MKKITYLFAILLLGVSCKKELIKPSPESDPESIFEVLWNSFNVDYALFEERGIDWNNQYEMYRNKVTSSTPEDDLFSVFKDMLAPLNDGHVQLVKPNEKLFYSNKYYEYRIEDDLFNLDLIKTKYLDNAFKINGYDWNTYGWLNEHIGYLHMHATSINWENIDEILDYFEPADGLIVDLRHNSGGDFTQAFSRFGRFMDQERLAFRSKSKNGVGKNDFTDWYDWKLRPAGAYFDKPIIVLTDRYTMSATERLVMAYQSLSNVVMVGDTTNGSLSSKILRELPNGWNYSICPQKVESPDGIYYEGIGIDPDYFIKNTSHDIEQGRDKVLEFALDLFL